MRVSNSINDLNNGVTNTTKLLPVPDAPASQLGDPNSFS